MLAVQKSVVRHLKPAATIGSRPQAFIRCLSSVSNENVMDVLIVGGGAVGCSLARLLNESTPSLKVGLLEAREAPSDEPSEIPHARSYALSPTSLELIGSNARSKLQLGYYDSMQIWQANSPASLTFTTRDLDADPLKAPYLGACVEDGPLVASLWNEIQGTTKCWTNTTVKDMQVGDHENLAQVTTSEGETIQTALLVGADGGNSWVRKTSGISRTGSEYDQHALTFTVELESSLNKRAFQRFLGDGGPMALLPTYSPNHAVIVWSTSLDTIQQWKDRAPEELVAHLNDCLLEGPQRVPPLLERETSSSSVVSNLLYGAERVLDTLHYGLAMASHHPEPKFTPPPRITKIVSPKNSFPLSCFQANAYTKGRVALVGDSAHTIHPMAGQGLNLGLSDVQVLVDCIVKAENAGMDLTTFLEEYGSNRKRNVTLSLGGIHTLQRLFANQDVPLQHAKTFGMNVIQNVGMLRRQLALAAAHGVVI
jgi:ubiquinone biosynthesis monooxygenase Coq6